MSTQDVRAEALLNIRCIVKGAHLCRFEVNVGEVFTATKKKGERGNAFKVVKMNGVYNYCVQRVNSVYANLQPIDTNLSIDWY